MRRSCIVFAHNNVRSRKTRSRAYVSGFGLLVSCLLLTLFGCAGVRTGSNGTQSPNPNPPTPSAPVSSPNSAPQFIYVSAEGRVGDSAIIGLKIAEQGFSEIPGSPFLPHLLWPSDLAASPNFLFSSHSSSATQGSTILSWKIDPTSGLLQQVGSVATDLGVASLTIDPHYQFLYGIGDPGVYGYSIDPSSGRLASLAGSPFSETVRLIGAAISPDGTLICGSGEAGPGHGIVQCERRIPSVGTILGGPGNEFTGESGEGVYWGFRFSPTGYLVVGSVGDTGSSLPAPTGLVVYRPGADSLEQVSSITLGSAHFGMNPAGDRIVASDDANRITLIALDPVTGALTQLAQIPSGLSSGGGAVAFTEDGKFVAIASFGTNQILVYKLSNDTLSPLKGSPMQLQYSPMRVVAPAKQP